MTIFADTSALYAVLDRDDDLHERAHQAWIEILSGPAEIVTSNYVVVESFALVQSRLGMDALRAFNDDVLPVVRVEWVLGEDHRSGAQSVLAADKRRLSLVDCTSFAIMRRLRLRSVFTFDAHFAEQGFQILPG